MYTWGMSRVGTGLDKVIEGQVQALPQGEKPTSDPLHVLLRSDALRFGTLYVLQRVVVGTGPESDLVTALTAVPSQHIRLDQLQGMPHMRFPVHVGN